MKIEDLKQYKNRKGLNAEGVLSAMILSSMARSSKVELIDLEDNVVFFDDVEYSKLAIETNSFTDILIWNDDLSIFAGFESKDHEKHPFSSKQIVSEAKKFLDANRGEDVKLKYIVCWFELNGKSGYDISKTTNKFKKEIFDKYENVNVVKLNYNKSIDSLGYSISEFKTLLGNVNRIGDILYNRYQSQSDEVFQEILTKMENSIEDFIIWLEGEYLYIDPKKLMQLLSDPIWNKFKQNAREIESKIKEILDEILIEYQLSLPVKIANIINEVVFEGHFLFDDISQFIEEIEIRVKNLLRVNDYYEKEKQFLEKLVDYIREVLYENK